MAKGNKKNKQFSDKFFRKPFPPNHNPLIGMLRDDTFHNIYDAMSTLQELTINCEQNQLVLSERSTGGLFYLQECIIHALHFELYHRKKD